VGSAGGITSSRCTNEETYLVQKLVRAAFGNNNVDTCARVCHSPTGYGLKTTLGESAGTQDFDSVDHADCVIVIGANPTDAHPVFASRMKRRLREGASLIVVDPRRIDLVRMPHVAAQYHLALQPGTNVAVLNALAHVIVTEGLAKEDYVRARCDVAEYEKWKAFISLPKNSPEAMAKVTGVPAARFAAPRAYSRKGRTRRSTTASRFGAQPRVDDRHGHRESRDVHGNIGREGVGVNPLRGQNNVQGCCGHGLVPARAAGLPPRQRRPPCASCSATNGAWSSSPTPACASPNMFDAASRANSRRSTCKARTSRSGSRYASRDESIVVARVHDRSGPVLERDGEVRDGVSAGSSFLEKNGTFTNAERRISPVRKVMEPLAGLEDWQVTQELSKALGYPMNYKHPSEIMDEIARLTPTFTGVSYDKLDKLGSIQWPCNDAAQEGTPTMHIGEFVRGKGLFRVTPYVPTDEVTTRKYPLLLTTGRILSQYNVGAQTRRTENGKWHDEDVLEIHPHDAEQRGIEEGDWVALRAARARPCCAPSSASACKPGVVYTTFHHPSPGANVVTTDNSDWATNCPSTR
jgi:formate dehydrogenase major subunit